MSALRESARAALTAGLCIIPAAANGTKQPWPDGPRWKTYETQQPTSEQIERWFANGRYDGFGIVCGRISGNLEMLEFEGRAVTEGLVAEAAEIAEASGLGDLWRTVFNGYRETTPSGGIHLLYRVAGPVAGNVKLAERPSTPDEFTAYKQREQAKIDAIKDPAARARRQRGLDNITRCEQVPQTLIETRGEGGFVIIAPSAGRTHPSGRGWTLEAGGYMSIPLISPEDRDALHHLTGALNQMPPEEEEISQQVAPRRPATDRVNGSDGLRPGDDYNQRATWDDTLIDRLGWTKVYWRGGTTYWRRAGKDRGVSATTGRTGADNLYVFSTSTIFEPRKPYSKFAAYTLVTEGATSQASFSAAAKSLRAEGYGSPLTDRAPRPAPAAVEMSVDDLPPHPADDPATEPHDDGWEAPPARRRGLLPDDFWDARPTLRHIRQAAHARARSGDIVLGGMLARLSSLLPPELRADTGVGSPASMNMFVILLGASGSGKSSAAWIPRKLLPCPPRIDFLDELPLGSGEGIAEAYMGEQQVETDEVYRSGPRKGERKTETVRMQVRHNALFYADEGESLTKQLFGRLGATVGESLRRAWTGGTIGQFNGHKVNTRVIESGTYSLGMVVGFQPETALPLLEDAPAGTPQRFLWCSSTDPSIPEDVVEEPGPLDLELIRRGFGIDPKISFATPLLRQIRAEDRARATGELTLPPLDSHKPLMLVKLSVLLAILDNRLDVTAEDWQLAEQMWATSCELRDALLEHAARQAAEEHEKRTKLHIDRELRAHTAKANSDRNVERVARRAAKRVHEAEGMTRGALAKAIAYRDRDLLPAALNLAEALGWISCDGDQVSPGDARPS
ncbi:bifunctional DNA primase/polymerase [Nonomuraea sp. SYSU D8015]|uniref:bifunctional DNA primase/polymerase n=1 Tax=Nonomuraea sp. SYSU D8015 TaxID=2593644 RepID=UPI001661176E|nr:bifunctional DNA primase/polymerase [Nonomuraea sp. SYSU D8015]